MRIIAGKFARRGLQAPEGNATRPFRDRVRQALFNILEHHDWGEAIGEPLEGRAVLDPFCGTGALAFEALSRGAAQAFLFDKDPNAMKAARANAASLGVTAQCRIAHADALKPPCDATPCQLVFMDPPYHKGLVRPAWEALAQAGWIAPQALIVVALAADEKLDLPEGAALVLERNYGNTSLYFVYNAPLNVKEG